MSLDVIYAREPFHVTESAPSVFLAGPTPRTAAVPSWRPDAIAALDALWGGARPLTVFTPESRNHIRAAEYHHQVEWEVAALDAAAVILFWIPRDVVSLPGFTTNVEFGLYASSGRVVLGCPDDCPDPIRNRYLIFTAERFGAPVRRHLPDTVATALSMLAGGGR